MDYTDVLNEISSKIGDSKISIIIAIGSLLISAASLLCAIIWNKKSEERYLSSIEPILNFKLFEISGILYLEIRNSGLTEATDINIRVLKLEHNGSRNIDKGFDLGSPLWLYPSESIICKIGLFDNSYAAKEQHPLLHMHIRYKTSKSTSFIDKDRKVCYTENVHNPIEITELKKFNDYFRSIMFSENRVANYLDGKNLSVYDELNIKTENTFALDIKNALNGDCSCESK